jgi:hypothetical protein
VTLSGVLRDDRGAALPRTEVLACLATVCYYGKSAVDGSFAFDIESPAFVALKTLPDEDASPRLGAALAPVALEGDDVHVGDLFVPTLAEGEEVDPSATTPVVVAAGDGLELTLVPADIEPAPPYFLSEVAARRIPPDQVPELPALGAEHVAAVYALHPFGAASRSPVAVRAPTDLPAGTRVLLRSISDIDGRLSEPVAGLSDGRLVHTEPGAGIEHLSWLVISRRPEGENF